MPKQSRKENSKLITINDKVVTETTDRVVVVSTFKDSFDALDYYMAVCKILDKMEQL